MGEKPLLAVVYSPRSRPWMEITEAAAELCRLLWIVDGTAFGATARVLGKFGEVVDAEGRTPEELIQAVYAHRPDGITCYWDPDLHRQAWLASALGLPTASVRTVTRLTDKLVQREALRAAGVPVPRFSDVAGGKVNQSEIRRLSAAVGFPGVLKPRSGTACQGIYPIDDGSHLVQTLTEMDDAGTMLFEERMGDMPTGGPYADRVSIETIVSRGVFSHLGVTGLFTMVPPFRSTGGFFPAPIPSSESTELFELATASIKALGSSFGSYRTEIKMTPDGPKIIEVNGRPTGLTPATVKLASGLPMLQLGMRLALGEHVVVEGPVPCHQIAYRFYCEPPMSATKIRSIASFSGLAELPGVRQVDVHKAVGDSVDWRNGSLDKVFQVTGTVNSYAELETMYAACRNDRSVTYEHRSDVACAEDTGGGAIPPRPREDAPSAVAAQG